MTEWGQNEEYFKIQFFLPPLKSSSFLLISSFSIISEWPGMKITMEIYHSQGIPFIFTLFLSLSSFQDAVGMMEWGWNEGYFWREAKPLIQKSPSFHHHSMSLSHSWYDHSIHLSIIPNFYFANQPLDAIQLSTKKSFLANGLKNGQNDLWMKGTGVVSSIETTPVPFIQRSL